MMRLYDRPFTIQEGQPSWARQFIQLRMPWGRERLPRTLLRNTALRLMPKKFSREEAARIIVAVQKAVEVRGQDRVNALHFERRQQPKHVIELLVQQEMEVFQDLELELDRLGDLFVPQAESGREVGRQKEEVTTTPEKSLVRRLLEADSAGMERLLRETGVTREVEEVLSRVSSEAVVVQNYGGRDLQFIEKWLEEFNLRQINSD